MSRFLKGCTIDVDQVVCHELICEGGYAEIYLATYDGRKVVLKKLKTGILDESTKGMLVSELKHLHCTQHDSIVKMFGYVAEPKGKEAIVLEYMEHGALSSFLRDLPHHPPLSITLRMVQQFTSAMHYLHHRLQPPMLHRDLKAANILVSSEFNVKLTDFGLSQWHDYSNSATSSHHSDKAMRRHRCTYTHVPPERLENPSTEPSEAFDVYSYGVTLWEVLTLENPAKYIKTEMDCQAIKNGHRPPCSSVREDCPAELKKTMLLCWDGNVKNRPYFTETILTIDALALTVPVLEDEDVLLRNMTKLKKIDDTILHTLLKWNSAQDVEELLSDPQCLENNFPNSHGKHGWTPLHVAAKVGKSVEIELLLSHGANINAPSQFLCQTPLHMAARYGNRACVEMLLRHKADVTLTDFKGCTALDVAERKFQPLIDITHGQTSAEADHTGCASLLQMALVQISDLHVPSGPSMPGAEIVQRAAGIANGIDTAQEEMAPLHPKQCVATNSHMNGKRTCRTAEGGVADFVSSSDMQPEEGPFGAKRSKTDNVPTLWTDSCTSFTASTLDQFHGATAPNLKESMPRLSAEDTEKLRKFSTDEDCATVLRIRFDSLCSRLDPEEVVLKLYSAGILEDFEKNSITSKANKQEGTSELVTKMRQRGKDGFWALVKCLEKRPDLCGLLLSDLQEKIHKRKNATGSGIMGKTEEELKHCASFMDTDEKLLQEILQDQPIVAGPSVSNYEAAVDGRQPHSQAKVGSTDESSAQENFLTAILPLPILQRSSSVKEEHMPVASVSNGADIEKLMPERVEGTKTSSPKSSNAEEFKTIAELSHLNKTWTTPIRCRVSHKTSIRPFYGPEEVDSQIFEVRIVDESGTISAYSWNQLCDEFFNKFEVNQVCTIVDGELKPASLEFEKSNHNSCIYLTTATKVLDYKELPTAPPLSFNLTKLSDISKKEDNTSIDVIGIIVRVAEKRSTNVVDVIFADDTGYLVPLQLILNDARISTIAENKILLIRDCCVRNWYSPYLVAKLTSTVVIDPEINEAQHLNFLKSPKNLVKFLSHGLTKEGVTLVDANTLPEDGKTSIVVKATVFDVNPSTYQVT